MSQNSNNRWDHLLPVHEVFGDSAVRTDYADGKVVLLTGGGGFIGSALAKKILAARSRELLLLDHSEQALYQLGQALSYLDGPPSYRLVPGDVGDESLIASLLREYKPDLILHSAAYKHVPLMEANPFAALQNNAIFTWQLAKAAAENGVPQLLLISTDKAANPSSILGASKYVAERAVLRWSEPHRRCSAIRLVNVLGSSGSVLPLFLEQIARRGPLTITHPNASRHFLTLDDTVGLILAAVTLPDTGVIYIPKLSEAVRIVDLANALLRQTTEAGTNKIRIEFVGLRPGEKLTEELLSTGESLRPTSHPAIQAATASLLSADDFDQTILQLKEIVQRRDLLALLEALRQIAPSYQPSSTYCAAGRAAYD